MFWLTGVLATFRRQRQASPRVAQTLLQSAHRATSSGIDDPTGEFQSLPYAINAVFLEVCSSCAILNMVYAGAERSPGVASTSINALRTVRYCKGTTCHGPRIRPHEELAGVRGSGELALVSLMNAKRSRTVAGLRLRRPPVLIYCTVNN